jgi:hypothetical protein
MDAFGAEEKMKDNESLKISICIIKELFTLYFSQYGFNKLYEKIDKSSYKLIYGKADFYVEFYCSIHPLDYPYQHTIVLGIGSYEFPESNQNSIPIWRLFKENENTKDLFLFDLGQSDENYYLIKFKKCKKLFEKYCKDFMKGNIHEFYVQKNIQDKEKEKQY